MPETPKTAERPMHCINLTAEEFALWQDAALVSSRRSREIMQLLETINKLRADRQDWELAHQLMNCGHPRACLQDENWPESHQNYDPETQTSNPSMKYRCIACEELGKGKSDAHK